MDSEHTGIKLSFLIFDLLLLNISVYMVYHNSPMYNYMDLPGRNLYILHANVSELLAYTIYSKRNYFFNDAYTERVKAFGMRFLVLFITLFLLAEIFLPENYHKGFLVEYTGFFFVVKVVVFYIIYKFHQYRYEKGYAHHRVAILGTGDADEILGRLLLHNPALGYKLVGYISDYKQYKDLEILGNINELTSLSEKFKLNMILVIDPKYFTKEHTNLLLSRCNETGLRVRYVLMKDFWNNQRKIGKKTEKSPLFEMFNPQEIPLDKLTLRVEKRIFDICFSLAVIVFLFSWLFPIIMIIIKLNSKGPVFFKQQRTGINNKTFTCLKFRTMTVNVDADSKQAVANDARITSVGKFMRRTNMDELPQFFNVLMGNMSVVGPRPHMLKHTTQYAELIQHYKVRHFVKPGITGWAQVNGYRGSTDELWKMEKRVEYDMEYLENWDFLHDMKIIFMTIFGTNAYKNAG